MLIVRFRETFRERAMEWGCAAALIAYGLLLQAADGAFDRAFYEPFARIAPQWAWSSATILFGAMRLVVLFINGAWWRTPQFRQVGCMFGMLVWVTLLMCTLQYFRIVPAAALYATMFLMDACSLSFAAADGKTASLNAPHRGRGAAVGSR